jgi:L-threonylcarbamoyladenylate synthase
LSIVLPRARAISAVVSAGLDTVAVRQPSHPVALALLRAAGVPVAAPSANRFMRTSATTAEHVLEDLDGRIDMIVDAGPTDAGIESTVVAIGDRVVHVLRKGAITAAALREAVAAMPGARVDDGAPPATLTASPGLMARHYAPRKPLTLVEVAGEQGYALLEREARRMLEAGERPGLLVSSEDAVRLEALPRAVVVALGPESDAVAIARVLFASMRALDRSSATVLLARVLPEHGLGAALNDRLRRAAEERLSG